MGGDDLALLAGAAAGDASALEALMSRYAASMYRLARGITRNEADAEEVVQDVFLTIVRKGSGFEGRSALSSWIYRITTNTALNKRRGRHDDRETSLEEHLPTYLDDGHRAGDRPYLLADWSGTPERELLAGEARDVLNAGLDALPTHYRAVLVLKDVEELSNEEVANVLGESVASVKSRVHRARMALREQFTRRLGARP